MRLKVFISIFMVVSILALDCGAGFPYTEMRSSSLSSQGTLAISPQALLDDFDKASSINLWKNYTGTFSSDNPATASSVCQALFTTANPYGTSVYSLQLNYNVSKVNSFAGYYSKLGGSLAGYTALSFVVRGGSGNEFFKIELRNSSADANYNHAAVYVRDYLDSNVISGGWQVVTIPLKNFASLDTLATATELVITFENAQCVANASPVNGTVYIDNITFLTTPVTTLRIDHFGDVLGTNAMGGNTGSGSGGGGSIIPGYILNQYHNYSNGFKIDYNVTTANSYAYAFLVFGGGNDGWVAVPRNYSAFNYLSFYIRALSDAYNPKGIKVELTDSGGSKFVSIPWNGANPVTSTWKQYRIPLNTFLDWSSIALDKTTIKQLTFTFENGNANIKNGTVYIDEVQFEQ